MEVNKILNEDYKKIFPYGLSLVRRIKLMLTNDSTYLRLKYIKYMRMSVALLTCMTMENMII